VIEVAADAIVTTIDDRELSRLPVPAEPRAQSCMPAIYAAAYPTCPTSRIVVSDIAFGPAGPR
jgi:hypothetical protein